jgi:hypothetical protein
MKQLTLGIFLLAFVQLTWAQEQKYNIVFKPAEVLMGEKQKTDINFVASHLMEGETIMFYPLAYDSIYDRYTFSNNAKLQATALAEYASSIGFQVQGFPRNFPSPYSGLSVGVILKYIKPIDPNALAALKPRLNGLFPEKHSQFFLINPLKDTIIIGNEGTILYLKAGCLLSNKKVQVELKEFYVLGDYIKSGLPTVSNGKILQTGGSIYLNARENDTEKKQVKIDPNKGVGVDFTLGKTDDNMQVFIKDPRTPNELNWILPAKRTVRESWEITETVLDTEGNVISETKYKSKEEWEQHLREEKKKKLEQEKKAAIKAETNNKMNSKLQVYNLGYINCDKFYDEPTMPLVVSADLTYTAEYYLVYSDIRGVMKGEVNGSKVHFGSVAQSRDAILIAVSYVDKQPYYFKCSIGAGGKITQKVALKPVDEKFLNQELALLK